MVLRPNLKEIEKSYSMVLKDWKNLDDLLDDKKIGRKDTPFDQQLMDNMMLAWEHMDHILKKKDYNLMGATGGPDLLEVNNCVHYGVNAKLRKEYRKAIQATVEKFSGQIGPIRKYYKKQLVGKSSAEKVAAEVYISILGMPQLYIEGNHRSGSIVASWINMVHGKPPFVLTTENALAFFKPAQEIKKFNKKSMWRSVTKLPKYKKEFRKFWVRHCDKRFVR